MAFKAFKDEEVMHRAVEEFQQSLNHADEWLFYHLAWVAGDTDTITYEDRYDIMLRWNEFTKEDSHE